MTRQGRDVSWLEVSTPIHSPVISSWDSNQQTHAVSMQQQDTVIKTGMRAASTKTDTNFVVHGAMNRKIWPHII